MGTISLLCNRRGEKGGAIIELLTTSQLAERWQVSNETIRNWKNEGVLQPAKGIPAIRFSMQHILELEGVKLEKFSPLLKRDRKSVV